MMQAYVNIGFFGLEPSVLSGASPCWLAKLRDVSKLNAMRLHCCERMSVQVNMVCKVHSNPFECPDVLVRYSLEFDEYGLVVHDGGSSSIHILFCPFCGTKLPESKRNRWFDELEGLGFAQPMEDDIPERYKSDSWYRT